MYCCLLKLFVTWTSIFQPSIFQPRIFQPSIFQPSIFQPSIFQWWTFVAKPCSKCSLSTKLASFNRKCLQWQVFLFWTMICTGYSIIWHNGALHETIFIAECCATFEHINLFVILEKKKKLCHSWCFLNSLACLCNSPSHKYLPDWALLHMCI